MSTSKSALEARSNSSEKLSYLFFQRPFRSKNILFAPGVSCSFTPPNPLAAANPLKNGTKVPQDLGWRGLGPPAPIRKLVKGSVTSAKVTPHTAARAQTPKEEGLSWSWSYMGIVRGVGQYFRLFLILEAQEDLASFVIAPSGSRRVHLINPSPPHAIAFVMFASL